MKELNKDFIINYDIFVTTIDGRDVYCTDSRVPMADVPEGFLRYEVRGSDGWGEWSTIENNVVVNFVATIITDEPFELTPHSYFNPFTGSEGVDYYYQIERVESDDFDDDILEMWDGGYEDNDLRDYEVVCWPESQNLMDEPNYRAFCFLINDEDGLERFGSSAYVVVKDWYNSL